MNMILKLAITFVLVFSIFAFMSVPTIVMASSQVQVQEQIYCSPTLEDDFTENEILITVHPQWNDKDYSQLDFQNIDCISVEEILDGNREDIPSRILKLELSTKSKEGVLNAIKVLQQRDDIYCAEPNYLFTSCAEPNDTEYVDGNQWAIDKMNLPSAWDITTGSSSVIVGIIDSGIDGSHPDLINQINKELSKSFTEDFSDPLADQLGHGTKVAGILGAEGNNSIGVVGICWDIQLVSLRVDNSAGNFPQDNVVKAINYAENEGIPILNYSGGGNSIYNTLKIAIANYSGLFVCAAGNEKSNNDLVGHYPSNYDVDNIIAVGASTSNDRKRSTSNYGATTVDIFAPGENLRTTLTGGGYIYTSGTSMASPYVAGVAALLLSEFPSMTPAQLKAAILGHVRVVMNENGESVFGDLCVSGGVLNAYGTLCHRYGYVQTGSLHTHDYVCFDCGYYVRTDSHIWIKQSTSYYCKSCKMASNAIPANPLALQKYAAFLTDYRGSDYFTIAVDEGTVLCFVAGQYYLVIAQSSDEALEYVRKSAQN